MSSSGTQRVGRAPKDRSSKGQYSPQGTKPPPDGPKAPDGVNPKNQPTAEQMRIAQITYDANKSDDPDLQRKIEQVMELTGKTADTVIIALHDCDNETERAVDMLLEGDQNESEWETSGKKKKNRQPTLQKPVDGTVTGGSPNNKDKENRDRGEKQRDNKREGGFRIRGPPRLTRGSGRNWRNKENEKNEKNLEENKRERTSNPEGRFRGARRGARGGRGSGRVRTFQNRGLSNSSSSSSSFPQSIDTWTNSTVEQTDSGGRSEGNMPVGNWSEFTVPEDWSEEDWNESLTETKVFTPSTGNQTTIELNENTRTNLAQRSIDLAALLHKPDPPTTQSSLQANGILQSHQSSSVSQSSSQSQFSMSQYAQQAAESIKAAVGITSSMNSSSAPSFSSSVFPSSDNEQPSVQLPGELQHAVNSHTNAQQVNAVSLTKASSALPQRNKTQKPRIPPPSKIPESAVEMPDDAIMALDVQFGALEFGADSSPFDFTSLSDSTANYQDSPLNSNTSHLNSQPVTGSHTGASNSSASLSTSLASSLSKEASFGLGVSAASTNHSSIAKEMPPSSVSMVAQPPKVVSGPESILLGQQQKRKSVTGTPYTNQRSASATGIDSSYAAQKASLLGAGSNNYIHQSSSLESQSLLGSSSSQNSYMSGSQSHNLSVSSAPYNMQQSYVQPQSVSYPSQAAYGQQSMPYSYSVQQGYSGSNSSTNHGNSLASSKLSGSMVHGVDSQAVSQHSYDTNSAAVLASTLASATTGNSSVQGLNASNISNSSALGLSSTSSSTTTTSVLKNSLSASKTLPTMPPGVPAAAMMSHQYIMGQAGLPFYGLQQPLYSSYEEMQMLPSRLQPLGYYDMQFPTATSLTGRDPNMGSVAYTGDIKYSRADTDVSSVATTLSQGQAANQAHGQTFLNPAALPHGYGYYFQGVVPGGIHPYGTPIFPVPAATNTHGASSSNQYQKTSFGSHSYCSGTGTATDLSNSIYSKAHTQLAKPGFHAGTPPPFNMATTQPTGPIGASSTPYGATPFIPVIQHHSTMLHHHVQQDSSQQGMPTGGPQRNSQQSMGQQKGSASKQQNFPYWNNN